MDNERLMEDTREMVDVIGQAASMPGGIEMLMTTAGMKCGGRVKKMRLYCGGRAKHAEGGLAAAEEVRQMGRGDDEVLLHVSPEEYEAIVSMWGEPDINPDTGLPEYGFLSKFWKGLKKGLKKIVKSPFFSMMAPIVLNAVVPGLGAAVGGKLAAGASAATQQAVGQAAVRGALGAATGGKEGALSGVVGGLTAGGGGELLGSKLGMTGALGKHAGNAIIGGIGGEIGGGGFTQGALGNVTNAMFMQPMEQKIGDTLGEVFDPKMAPQPSLAGEMAPVAQESQIFDTTPEAFPNSPIPDAGGSGDLTIFGNPSTPEPWYQDAWNWTKDNPMLALGAAGFAGSMMGGGSDSAQPPQLPPEFLEPLSTDWDFGRYMNPMDPDDYYTYGQVGGEHTFLGNNQIGNRTNRYTPSPSDPTGGLVQRDQSDLDFTRNLAIQNYPDQSEGSYAAIGQGDPMLDQILEELRYGTPQSDEAYLQMLTPMYGQDQSEGSYHATGQFDPSLQRILDQLKAYAAGQPYTPSSEPGMARGGYVGYAQGGPLGHATGQGSGRDDTIEALLSDGEFVMDAETVSLLGDGSNSEGAKRLEELRQNLRKHKGSGLSKGKFSPDAKRPEEYMTKMRTRGRKKRFMRKLQNKYGGK